MTWKVGLVCPSELRVLVRIHLACGVGPYRLRATVDDVKNSGIIREIGRAEPGNRAYCGPAARLLRGRSRASGRGPLIAVVVPAES